MCFFNDTATAEIFSLALHDALPICSLVGAGGVAAASKAGVELGTKTAMAALKKLPGKALIEINKKVGFQDRQSTRLNSSHANISYAVFCLKQKHSTTS